MKKKYVIVPKDGSKLVITTEHKNETEIINDFIAFINEHKSEVLSYFDVVQEKDYNAYYSEIRNKHHREFVVDWMKDTLESDFSIPESESQTYAEIAYDGYCDGKSLTEYGAVEYAADEFEKAHGIETD